MPKEMIVVEGLVPADTTVMEDLRTSVWSFALDQRAFGPRKLMVAFADADGRIRGIAHTKRTRPVLVALEACLDYLGTGAAAAVAFCDERVEDGPPPVEFLERFEDARRLCQRYGVHLVDWFACDDDAFRSARCSAMTAGEPPDWWDLPTAV